MGKQDYSEAVFDHVGGFDREATIDDREFFGEQPTRYDAPKDRKWRARNLVTIHWNILNYPCPYPSMVYILACVIDHANINTGRCDASQKVMAIETNYHVNTVRKVLDWVAANTPFLKIERRVGTRGQFRSNAYHVQWQHLEVDWIGIQVCIDEAKQEHRASRQDSTMHTQGCARKVHSRVCTDHAQSRVDANHEVFNHEEEPRHEMVRPPSVADTDVISSSEGKKEEGIQGEQVALSSLLPEGLTYGKAQEIVSGYCTGLHWEHLTQEDFDSAVAAEIEQLGSGRAVVDAAAERNAREAVNG